MAQNERKTEELVEAALREKGYLTSDVIQVEKQASESARVSKLLATASKKGGGVGRPEFIIRSSADQDFLVVIECKADPAKHVSVERDRYADYAVDGVLLYADYLARDFDVLAIAVSGQTAATLRISHFFQLKGTQQPHAFATNGISSFEDYRAALLASDIKFRQDYTALLDYSRTLNNLLQARKVTEADRGFLISGILIALKNRAFVQSYTAHTSSKHLADSLLSTINAEFEAAELPATRRATLAQAFSFIAMSPALLDDHDFFVTLIGGIDHNIHAFMRTHKYYDTIGQFYVEFLRYANNDKGLGIVLTPLHIAELFADIAEVNHASVVYDNCCGTAGLLISAMKVMTRSAGADQALKRSIRTKQLIGVEFQPKVYALAVSNMVLHDDGKTNIFRDDCLTISTDIAKKFAPTVGILNPPYKNKAVREDREELEYVENNLSKLRPGSKCVAIVPITCATAPSGEIALWKQRLLERHTLEAVMSMPIDLFHNSKTTVVTCVMVLTAHHPHPAGKKSWFGYWRDDGFVKTKHRGRLDVHGTWAQRRQQWLSTYRSRDVIAGYSVTREVGPADEWCAEAYLDIDYGQITDASLISAAKRYLLQKIAIGQAGADDIREVDDAPDSAE